MRKRVFKEISEATGQEITYIVSEKLENLDLQKQLPAATRARFEAFVKKNRKQLEELIEKHRKK